MSLLAFNRKIHHTNSNFCSLVSLMASYHLSVITNILLIIKEALRLYICSICYNIKIIYIYIYNTRFPHRAAVRLFMILYCQTNQKLLIDHHYKVSWRSCNHGNWRCQKGGRDAELSRLYTHSRQQLFHTCSTQQETQTSSHVLTKLKNELIT